MASSEKFCLRWNDFEANISNAFLELKEENDFTDVTLVCGDNQVDAHKVILAASSPFFKRILKENPHSHPLIYLKGIKSSDVKSVLDFIYLGEVNIEDTNLKTFLEVAEDLEVKGLVQGRKFGEAGSNPMSSVSRSNVQSLAKKKQHPVSKSDMQSADQMYDQLYSQTTTEIASPWSHTVNNNTNRVMRVKVESGGSPKKKSIPAPVLESLGRHQEQCSQITSNRWKYI